MSVIAFDGRYIAADQRSVLDDSVNGYVRKLRQHGEEVLGAVGPIAHGVALVQWYAAGADPDSYPDGNDATLIAASYGTVPRSYGTGFPVDELNKYMAWGHGTPVGAVLALMHEGYSAVESVAKAVRCERFPSIGHGVTWFDLKTLSYFEKRVGPHTNLRNLHQKS